MRRHSSSASALRRMGKIFVDIAAFFDFLFYYLKKKITRSFLFFEKEKNSLVKFFMMKRGRYNRPFLHLASVTVLGLGILIGPFLQDTLPVFGQTSSLARVPSPAAKQEALGNDQNVFETKQSSSLRTTVITYTAQPGDTISTIAQKFGISEDTVRWANALANDTITSGDQLQIPPVTGVVHKVQAGETIYSIAKEYGANPQALAEFPGNDFANPETFSLVEGQMLVVPDGIMPTASNPAPKPVYAETPDTNQTGGSVQYNGGWAWPVHGIITTYFRVWHPGIDIAGPTGTPVDAIMGGTVTSDSCGWNTGYGCEVVIQHPNGWWSRYAHLNGMPLVHVGEVVSGGQQIGNRGSTGNSTGPHLHFEMHQPGGGAVNPLNYLP